MSHYQPGWVKSRRGGGRGEPGARRPEEWGGKPLQSVFTHDCIERGLDIDRGGARYNWAECSFVGLANLVGCPVCGARKSVPAELLEFRRNEAVLDADFQGNERLRQRFPNAYQKYGNGFEPVDGLVARDCGYARGACAPHRLSLTARLRPRRILLDHARAARPAVRRHPRRTAGRDAFCGWLRRRPGARKIRPDRRDPLGHRLGCYSADRRGGLQHEIHRLPLPDPRAARRLQDLIVTFLERGGFETQVNVVDAAVLRAAQAQPEEYRDLVVRIGGYTDYFTRLTPEMQAEVLLRTEYSTL